MTEAGESRVWFLETAALEEPALHLAAATLSADERARAERFHFARDRRDYIAAHALTRALLACCDGRAPAALSFDTGPRGKPILLDAQGAPSRWSFSLSHTHGLVACGVACDACIGVDVETCERAVGVDAVATRYFAPAEIGRLQQAAAEEKVRLFLEIWTLKEALVKAIGVGLSFPLQEIAFTVLGDDIRLTAPAAIDPSAWRFTRLFPTAAHVLSMATTGPAPAVSAWSPAWSDSAPLQPGEGGATP